VLNFLALDDLQLGKEGETVDPDSVICLPVQVDLPRIPAFEPRADDPFVQQVQRSGHKWVILCGEDQQPLLVLDADEFLRSVFLRGADFDAYSACHRPVVVRNPKTTVGRVLRKLSVQAKNPEDDVIDRDLILLWTDSQRRVVTGADLLGYLMRGVVPVAGASDA
jgi:hypothetical protein